jgi:hypothetical protein
MKQHGFEPVSTIADLESLNDDEILEGYLAGSQNLPCGDNVSRSYWHGWRNGMVDFQHMKPDYHMMYLAKEAINNGYLAGCFRLKK